MTWLIEFRFPEGILWAGRAGDGALGWAPTPATALRFDTKEKAGRFLSNGYGDSARYGFVVTPDELEPEEATP